MIKDKESKKKFYITTPIYYTSGKPHLGHAYTSIACDVLARWNRNVGKKVFFLTGTDEHGQKVEQKAKEYNMKPKEFVDSLIPAFVELNEKLSISNDFFIRTTDSKHKEFVAKMLQIAYDKGDIYKGEYVGLYCVDCEQYYKEADLIDSKICPIHKREVKSVKEENYFFKLSKYQDKLLEMYKKNPDFLSPRSKAQETINRVKEGLEDISISRSKKSLSWGIEMPFDSTHVTYVWFDALFNYVSGLDMNNKQDFWPCDVHVIGKDIMWFHTVYWPAFLMSCGYDLPKKVFSHGWWTVNSDKMGKSMDNVIDPIEITTKYGTDEFRFFMLANGSFGEDLDFTYELFASKINNELNNDLGNLVSRVHAMTTKYFDGIIPKAKKLEKIDEDFIFKLDIYEKFNSEMQELKFNFAIDTLWSIIRETNAYVNLTCPWKEQDKDRLAAVMNILCSSVYLFAKYINCFMPEKSARIFKQYNLKNDNKFKFELIKAGHKLGEKDNLFSKVIIEEKKEEPKKDDKKETSTKIEGFASLNLKVGKIISAKQHPGAEKLYIETIDCGEEKPRQIVSGLKGIYELEQLIGKTVIVAANLKPAKLRGEISQGMVLACEDENKKVGLLTSNGEIGDNLVCNRIVANNNNEITIDDFFKIKMNSDGKKVYFENKEILVGKDKVFIDRNIAGKIC